VFEYFLVKATWLQSVQQNTSKHNFAAWQLPLKCACSTSEALTKKN